MTLESDGAFAKSLGLFFVVVGFGVFVGHLAVDGDGDFFALDLDLVGEPLVVFVAGFLEVLKAVDAAGFAPVLVAGIDLAFVTLRGPALVLEFGVNENTGVGVFRSLDFTLELEVLELGIAVLPEEEVGAGAFDFDRAIFDREGFGVLGVDLPALEGFSVEHLNPLAGEGEGGGGSEDDGE